MLLTQKQQNQPPSSSEKNTNSNPLLPTRTPLPPPSPQPQISKMPPGPGTRGPQAGLEFPSRQAKPTPVTAASRANNNNNNNNKKIIFNKYELGRLLGCGAFAKVYHARNLKTGQSVAIKCINKLRILKTNLAPNIKREVSIMRRLHHPNVVPIIEVLATRSTIYFVMEFVRGGELFTRLSSSGRFSENLSRSYFRNLIFAVAHCHSRGVFHRDLKLENLLLDENGNVKVSDFGLSALNNEQIRPDGLFHTLCGTPAYVAPEVLSKKGYDGAKVDLWSCGVILFVLNAGFLPFNDSNLMQMYRKIYQGEYRIPKWTSPELKRLINRLLDTNPVTRITMEGILKDPWFNKGMNEEEVKTMIIGGLHGGYGDHDAEEYLTSTKVNNVESSEEECDRELNAFDIISFSSGCNLSGLFDRKAERDRFVSYGSPAEIIHKVEEIARIEGFVVRNRKEKVGIGRHGIAVKGQDGNLIAWVDCHRLSPGMVVVEVEKGDLDDHSRWNSGFWKEKLGPASEPTTPMSYHHRAIDMMGCASQPTSPISGNSSEIEIMDSDSEQDFPFPNPENHRSLTM